ncbi:MAG: ribonuclease HII [Candidatus Woesearchaeota archaeon]
MKIVAGVEEAGRGPVIGPLVMAVVTVEESQLKLLEELGVKDSKQLKLFEINFLYEKIKEICKTKTIIINPREIDVSLISNKFNLNQLEALVTAKLISSVEFDEVMLDCPMVKTRKYVHYVEHYLKKNISGKIFAENKADEKYVVVAAASIIAKKVREREIEGLKKKHGVDFGSGYPGDRKTINFVKENYNKYNFFRKSWSTYKKHAFKSKKLTVFDK